MNKRQVTILWIIALLLAAAVAVLQVSQNQSTDSATERAVGETVLEKFPAAEVATIQITGVEESVTLAKKDGSWTVSDRDGFPADPKFVNSLLLDLAELKVTQGLEAGPSFAARFGIDASSSDAEKHGLIATFQDESGKQLAKVGLGKRIQSNAQAAPTNPMGGGGSVGRYIRNFADESGFYAVSELFPSVSAEAPRWLNQQFISPEKIKSVSLSDKDGDAISWKVMREDEEAEMKLADAKPEEVLDTTKAAPFKSLFSYARFEDVVPKDQVAERSAEKGRQTAVIETFEGFTYRITLTPEKSDAEEPANYLVTVDVNADIAKERKKPEEENEEEAKKADEAFASRVKSLNEKLEQEQQLAGRTFLVSKSSVDALLKERSELITTAEAPQAGESPQETGMITPTPGGMVHTPPVKATTKPVEAVTPPIAIPPMNPAEEKPDTPTKPDTKPQETPALEEPETTGETPAAGE